MHEYGGPFPKRALLFGVDMTAPDIWNLTRWGVLILDTTRLKCVEPPGCHIILKAMGVDVKAENTHELRSSCLGKPKGRGSYIGT